MRQPGRERCGRRLRCTAGLTHAGADVVATTCDLDMHQQLLEIGAAEMSSSVSEKRIPVHTAIEAICCGQLGGAFSLLRSKGTMVSVGRESGAESDFTAADPESMGYRPGSLIGCEADSSPF